MSDDAMDLETEVATHEKRRSDHLRRTIDLLSSALMAAATVATAWSAYQSGLWNTDYGSHKSKSTTATIRVGKLSNLAMQRTSVHVNLFVHWVAAVHAGDTRKADFFFARFPEPLRAAASAWRATNPLTNPDAPATPFDMPEYVVAERTEADRWEAIADRESTAAETASEISNRYLRFTIIFASVLFFAGISGKFGWQAIDVAVLVLGALTLLIGVAVMFSSPRV
jgi:hypothetical protein